MARDRRFRARRHAALERRDEPGPLLAGWITHYAAAPMAVPQHVVDLATACVASVNATVGVELDFTPETLPILDHYARGLEQSEDEILQLIAPMCGAYFGEVVRRRLEAARWHAPEDELADWRIEHERVFLYFNPVGVALEVITEADAAGWSAHFEVSPKDREAVRQSVELYGDVRPKDYYTFAMRYEVVQQVAEALVRAAKARGEEKKTFGSQDYRSSARSAR